MASPASKSKTTKPNRAARLWRLVWHRPRLSVALLIGVVAFFAIRATLKLDLSTVALLAWNIGAGLYLALAWSLMFVTDAASLKARAEAFDEGEGAILILSSLAAVASLLSIIVELGASHNLTGLARAGHIGLSFVTILTSWAFIHTAFALHYAHNYYRRPKGAPAPLGFPGDEPPLYPDFLYFAFIIGTSGQTADVSLSSGLMRRIGLVHCVMAFVFNTTVVALMINLAAGLISLNQ